MLRVLPIAGVDDCQLLTSGSDLTETTSAGKNASGCLSSCVAVLTTLPDANGNRFLKIVSLGKMEELYSLQISATSFLTPIFEADV